VAASERLRKESAITRDKLGTNAMVNNKLLQVATVAMHTFDWTAMMCMPWLTAADWLAPSSYWGLLLKLKEPSTTAWLAPPYSWNCKGTRS